MWVDCLGVDRSINKSWTEQGKKLWIMKEGIFLTWMGRKMLKMVGWEESSVLMQRSVVWFWLSFEFRFQSFFQEIGLVLSSMLLSDLNFWIRQLTISVIHAVQILVYTLPFTTPSQPSVFSINFFLSAHLKLQTNQPYINLVANEFVKSGTELTLDYDPSYSDDQLRPLEGMRKCSCGSRVCRGWVWIT